MRPIDYTLTFDATAGNVVATVTNGTFETLEILFGEILVTTDATVANRQIRLSLYDPDGALFMSVHPGAAITASLTAVNVGYFQGIYRETSIIDNALQVPLPMKATVQSGWSMKAQLVNGVAGDSFSGKFYAREVRE